MEPRLKSLLKRQVNAKIYFALLFTFALFLPAPSYAWGKLGHQIVGDIAELLLTKKADIEVSQLLGGQKISEAANWADDIKGDDSWIMTRTWHFWEPPLAKPKRHQNAGDVISATKQMIKIVEDGSKKHRSSGAYNGKKLLPDEALKFLIHFVGDIHQPLHLGSGTDRGGNDFRVKWFGETQDGKYQWNLHSVWDFGIPKEIGHLSKAQIQRELGISYQRSLSQLMNSSVDLWAEESKAIRSRVYPATKSGGVPNLEKKYLDQNLPIARDQLFRAGIRLAGILNRIFRN